MLKQRNVKLNFYEEINPNQFKVNRQGIITWNTGIYGNNTDNAFPQFCADLYENGSSIHQNLVNLRANLLRGNNLQALDDLVPEETHKLEAFIAKRNKVGDNLKAVYGKVAQDMALFNGAVLQILWAKDGTIAEVYHIPTQNFRLGKPDNYDRVEFGYVSTNFDGSKNNFNVRRDAVKLRMYNPTEYLNYPVQLMYIKPYSYQYYSTPIWTSCIPDILLLKEIKEFHLANVRSNMFLSGMLTQKKAGMTDEEIDANADAIEKLYKGKDGRKILLNYVDDLFNDKPIYEKFAADQQDQLFDVLIKSSQQSIVTANSAYSILAGIDEGGSDLGGSSNRLAVAAAAYYNLVVHPMKEIVLGYFNQLADVNKIAYMDVITEPLRLTQPQALVEDLTEDERRKMIYDLPPKKEINENNDTPNT